MLFILLKNRLKAILSFTKDKSKFRWFLVASSLIILVVWFFWNVWSNLSQIIISDPTTGSQLLNSFVYLGFHGAFLVLCFYGISFAIFTVFFGKDIELLFSLPIKPTTIYFYKFIEATVMNLRFSMIFLVPVLIISGSYFNMGFIFYFSSMIVLLLLTSIPGSIGIILASFAVKRISVFNNEKSESTDEV